MEKNIFDKASDKMMKRFSKIVELAESRPYHPYGKLPATKEEKRKRFENLNAGDLANMIQKYGREEVNAYLAKFMGGDNYGR